MPGTYDAPTAAALKGALHGRAIVHGIADARQAAQKVPTIYGHDDLAKLDRLLHEAGQIAKRVCDRGERAARDIGVLA